MTITSDKGIPGGTTIYNKFHLLKLEVCLPMTNDANPSMTATGIWYAQDEETGVKDWPNLDADGGEIFSVTFAYGDVVKAAQDAAQQGNLDFAGAVQYAMAYIENFLCKAMTAKFGPTTVGNLTSSLLQDIGG